MIWADESLDDRDNQQEHKRLAIGNIQESQQPIDVVEDEAEDYAAQAWGDVRGGLIDANLGFTPPAAETGQEGITPTTRSISAQRVPRSENPPGRDHMQHRIAH